MATTIQYSPFVKDVVHRPDMARPYMVRLCVFGDNQTWRYRYGRKYAFTIGVPNPKVWHWTVSTSSKGEK